MVFLLLLFSFHRPKKKMMSRVSCRKCIDLSSVLYFLLFFAVKLIYVIYLNIMFLYYLLVCLFFSFHGLKRVFLFFFLGQFRCGCTCVCVCVYAYFCMWLSECICFKYFHILFPFNKIKQIIFLHYRSDLFGSSIID